MAKTRVSQGANGQYKVTVPEGLAEVWILTERDSTGRSNREAL